MTPTLPVFYDPRFAAPIGETHTMPMRKFGMVADALRGRDDLSIDWRPVQPVTAEGLRRVHTSGYVDAVRTGAPRALAESQKFPWSDALWSSVLLTNGAVVQAAAAALDHGGAAALCSGFHHAHADHGEGFCTFNGLAVAAEVLRASGRAQRVAVLDLDLHYGNGTASLCVGRAHLSNLSIYGNDYHANRPYRDVQTVRHCDGPNHRSVALPNGSGLSHLLAVLGAELPWLLRDGRPDVLIYQAGADPYREDPYSPLDLSLDDLVARDTAVFRFAKRHGLPVAWVLAGGYTADTSKVVSAHVGTFDAWASVARG